jgi:hypothetical protein
MCDNANNRYSHEIDLCRYIVSAYDAIRAANWGTATDELREIMSKRSIPVEVIAEVLAGCQDHNFSDWMES